MKIRGRNLPLVVSDLTLNPNHQHSLPSALHSSFRLPNSSLHSLLGNEGLYSTPYDSLPGMTSTESSFTIYDTLVLTNDTNATNTGTGYVPYYERPETYIVPILFAAIFIVGVIGNGTLIIIFAKNRNLRNVPNTYIISLALGDLLVLFFTVPFVSTIYTIESWPYGNFECKFSELVRDISVGVTVFTLTALSADRYLAIVSTVRRAAGGAGRRTLRAAVGIWVAAGVLATPAALFSHVREFNVSEEKNISVCFPFPEHFPEWYPRANIIVKALLYYLLPLVVIATFYLLMARHLLSSDDVPGESHVFHRQLRTRRKVAKIVLCFVLIFAVCFLPTHVFLLWFYFDPQASVKYNEFWHALRIIGFCLGFINSCINPIALYCISGTFRKYYNRYLFCCCRWVDRGHRTRSFLQPGRSGMSRCRSFTMRGTETITLTTLIQERASPAIS
ncbi:neuropeptide CCHamide-1 receptor-like [Homarus americanus]|uniref:neuropeptide CCHamide-1 receptor-like n=1 Tax=Homarus americanus TaxID=6706 RepID=UPI001C47D759|nr:neuropeptide CCHamide-1 receptor-like [Homarus americanus]